MSGARATTQTARVEGHCEGCGRTVARSVPSGLVAERTGNIRLFCAVCGHPTLCEVVDP